jgi:hypothetical protein
MRTLYKINHDGLTLEKGFTSRAKASKYLFSYFRRQGIKMENRKNYVIEPYNSEN